jgi:hypothetical protein
VTGTIAYIYRILLNIKSEIRQAHHHLRKVVMGWTYGGQIGGTGPIPPPPIKLIVAVVVAGMES